MPLPLTTLDRLTYDELVAEARSHLPVLAPNWTDYNAHDPGITLIELLAWLAEGASYRLNHIPEESYRAFLRLVGVEQRPAQVARTLVVFQTTVTQQMSRGVVVQSNGGDVQFQTSAPIFLSDAQLQTILRSAGGIDEDLSVQNQAMKSGILPFGLTPQVGDALYLGFDRRVAPAGTEVMVGLWTENGLEDQTIRTQLAAEQHAIVEEVTRLCPGGSAPDQPDWRQHYSVGTVWEYYANNGSWQPLQNVVDDTRALTLSGTVSFVAPADSMAGGVAPPTHSSRYFVRCRLERGVYDCPPRLAHVALNVVWAQHAVDGPGETFRSDGRAAQSMLLARRPVVMGNPTLTVTLKNGTRDGGWRAVPHWDGVSPHDRAYVLAPETGIVSFGDGRRGRVPAAGATIEITYQTGGGISGNIAANTLVQLVPALASVTVRQPMAASGGAAAETFDEAKARAVRELAAPQRAVTLRDFEALALATPGVPLARAHAIADYHPAMHCIPVHGNTTVVVVPSCPDHRPEPSAALCATVQRYLERRRLLSGEIHVIGPRYVTIVVHAKLQARLGTDLRTLMCQASATLDAFFHPLRGGPDGKGWPMGRAVYRSEILALLNELLGVVYVDGMSLDVVEEDQPESNACCEPCGGDTTNRRAAHCGNLTLCPHDLVTSGPHNITVNEGSACHE